LLVALQVVFIDSQHTERLFFGDKAPTNAQPLCCDVGPTTVLVPLVLCALLCKVSPDARQSVGLGNRADHSVVISFRDEHVLFRKMFELITRVHRAQLVDGILGKL
jgi:hypothetical protein